MRILLAEDDIDLGSCIKEGLEQNGYTVDWVQNGRLAIAALQTSSEHFDLAILDINMPYSTGLEVLKTIRNDFNNVPVFILTAKDQIEDKIAGLDSGADDYIIKPFDLNELCARIRSIKRRSSGRTEINLSIGGVELDPASHNVFVNNSNIVFSRREFSILQKLIEKKNKVVSRENLIQTLYGWEDEVDSNTIEVHMHNLRKKIANAASIRTIRGVGYIIEDHKK